VELPQGGERINPCQQKMRPVIFPALPIGLHIRPLLEFDFLRMFQRRLKYILRFSSRRLNQSQKRRVGAPGLQNFDANHRI